MGAMNKMHLHMCSPPVLLDCPPPRPAPPPVPRSSLLSLGMGEGIKSVHERCRSDRRPPRSCTSKRGPFLHGGSFYPFTLLSFSPSRFCVLRRIWLRVAVFFFVARVCFFLVLFLGPAESTKKTHTSKQQTKGG